MLTCLTCRHCIQAEYPAGSVGANTGRIPSQECGHPETTWTNRVTGEAHRNTCSGLRYPHAGEAPLSEAGARCGHDDCPFWEEATDATDPH